MNTSTIPPFSLRHRLPLYAELMRLHRPIGIWLLLWPTLWAVWVAGQGRPSWSVVLIFTLGVIIMRSAGCVINDWADRDFDGQVSRTQGRPLADGRLPAREALYLFAVLIACAALLLPFLNLSTFFWSFGALALASLYPFMKRFTYLPQVVLGMAFSWSMPMAWAAQGQVPDSTCWLLYLANLLWTVAYDTQYAMADRDDDLKAGIKSTAILFGRYDLSIISALQWGFLAILAVVGQRLALGLSWWLTLLAAAVLFIAQYRLCRDRQAAHCFSAFLQNHYVGLLIFGGLALSLYLQ